MAGDRGKKISVLMYHAITDSERGAEKMPPPERRYAVPLDKLRETLSLVRVKILSPSDWADAASGKTGGVLFTFDDSRIHHLKVAAPELEKRGIRAVFAVTADFIGKEGMLSWDGVKALRDAGHEIASHGKTHRLLELLSDSEIRIELEESKSIIEERTGLSPGFLSLPGGSADARVLEAARRAGYKAVFSSRPGYNCGEKDAFLIRRFAIRNGYSAARAAALANGEVPAAAREKIRYSILGALRLVLGRKRYSEAHESV